MEGRRLVILAVVVVVLGFSVIGFANSWDTLGTIGRTYQSLQNKNHELLCSTGAVYTGQVVWSDENSHRIMISGFDGNKIFDVSMASTAGQPGADHFATVTYTLVNGERIASSVTAVPRDEAYLYTPESYTG